MTRRHTTHAAAILVTAAMTLVLAPVMAAAQDPVKSFDLLNTRLKPGDTVWVTDAEGRQIKGRIATLGPSALTLNGDQAGRTFRADDVRVVVQQRRDSLKNGVLWGAGLGFLGGVTMVCVGDSEMCSDPEGKWGTVMIGLIGLAAGAGVGAGIDGLIHGRDVAYRAPGAGPSARLSLAPIVTARTKGVRLSFSF